MNAIFHGAKNGIQLYLVFQGLLLKPDICPESFGKIVKNVRKVENPLPGLVLSLYMVGSMLRSAVDNSVNLLSLWEL